MDGVYAIKAAVVVSFQAGRVAAGRRMLDANTLCRFRYLRPACGADAPAPGDSLKEGYHRGLPVRVAARAVHERQPKPDATTALGNFVCLSQRSFIALAEGAGLNTSHEVF